MPQRFNVNEPTTEAAINQFISSYETPEIADRDISFNAPRGRNYLAKQYQRIKGNPSADPFADASRRNYEAVMQAARSGYSVSTGSNMGPSILGGGGPDVNGETIAGSGSGSGRGKTRKLTPVSIAGEEEGGTETGFPSSVKFPEYDADLLGRSPRYRKIVRDDMLSRLAQAKVNQYKLDSKEMVLDPQAPDYLDKMEQRAELSGVGNLYRRIPSEVFYEESTSPVGSERFARTEGGKVRRGDALNVRLINHPEFLEAARRDPVEAQRLYAAVTNNRNYKTDRDAYIKLDDEQDAARRKLIGNIQNPHVDPATGKIMKMVESKDSLGNTINRTPVELDDAEKAVVREHPNIFKEMYGVDIPGLGGVKPFGETQEEIEAHQQLMSKFVNEGLLPSEANIRAQNVLHNQQRAKLQAERGKLPQRAGGQEDLPLTAFLRPKDFTAPYVNAYTTMLDAGIAGPTNLALKGFNAISSMMGSETRAPILEIPKMDWAEPETWQGREETERGYAIGDRLRRKYVGRALRGFLGQPEPLPASAYTPSFPDYGAAPSY